MPAGALSTVIPAGQSSSRFRKGEIIFDEGDDVRGAYEIESGWVRLQIMNEEGHRQILSFLTVGDSFGFNSGAYSLTAEAVTDVKLTRVQIRAALAPDASLEAGRQVLRQMSRRFDELAHHMQQLLYSPVEQRVLCFLAWLAHRQGPEPTSGFVRIPMGRQDIADYLGVAAATLSRTMTQLQQRGRITLRGPRCFRLAGPPRFVPQCRAAESICGACRAPRPH